MSKVEKRLCTGPCGQRKELNNINFKRRPGSQRYLGVCRVCSNAQERARYRGVRRGQIDLTPIVIPDYQPKSRVAKAKRYVITYAQNATPVHEEFLAALRRYTEHHNAKLVAIAGRYHNPTSHWSRAAEHDDWWVDELRDCLFDGRHEIGPNLTVYGDISIQPTAARPLSGFEVFAGPGSAIFGHPKIQLQAIATASREHPRLLTTTGAVTIPNYTDSKAGKKAAAHHVQGAAVVERAPDGRFHIRQINAEPDGTFIDLDLRFTPTGVEPAPRAAALVCGDIHVDKSVAEVLEATLYGERSIAAVLQPEKIVYHDLLDFAARNHHRINDPFDRILRAEGYAVDSVEAELDQVVEFLERTPEFAEPVVIASNHDDALDRWLKTADPRQDPVNARIFHQLWADLFAFRNKDGTFAPALELFYKNWSSGKRAITFVRRNEPYKIHNIVCSFHGDKGINGARGTTLSYAKLGVKTIIGHHHSPTILDGCYQVGVTGALDQGYNDLPGSWMHSHCVIYANSKRTLIHVIDGRWRA